MINTRRLIPATVFATALALIPLGVGVQSASAATSGVSVQGTGTVKVVPDTVRLNATISFVGATNSAASTASTPAASSKISFKEKATNTGKKVLNAVKGSPKAAYNYVKNNPKKSATAAGLVGAGYAASKIRTSGE